MSAPPQSLLTRVTTGEPAAVRQCVAEYGPLVWSLARRFSSDTAQTEAATLDAFLELWRQAGRFDPRQTSEPAFITMVVRRRLIEQARQGPRSAVPRPFPEASFAEQPSTIEHCAEASLASGILASLDPRQRRALALAVGQGMDPTMVSQATGMPAPKVRSLLRRALVAVRKQLLIREGSG